MSEVVELLHVDTPLLVPMPHSNRYMLERDMEVKYTVDGIRMSTVIRRGYCTDGASIPSVAWQLIGTPFSPKFMAAAIVHDYMCDKEWDVSIMSDLFKEMLQVAGVSNSKAHAMYVAVLAYKSVV